MKNLTKKTLLMVLVLTFVAAVAVNAYDPDNNADPLITKSYVDTTIIPYVDNAVTLKVETLTKDQMLIGEAGCEIILRMGNCTIIATEKGGICDTTIGGDWPNGASAPSNHHLIVPISDGRGIKAENDVIVLVKGKYTIY